MSGLTVARPGDPRAEARGVEFSGRPGNIDAYLSLAKQAGKTNRELEDDLRAGGLNAVTRVYAARAAVRNRRRKAATWTPRQAQVELLRRALSP